jgi:membrane protease YdiL (CAAX protease family)
VLFFAGLIVFYVGVLVVTRPVLNGGEAELNKIAFGVMLAPTVGAVLACVFGPGVIRFGMPSWWLLASFLPAIVVFLLTMVAAPISDAVMFHKDKVGALLVMAVVQSLLACISALGEEIGWRGFLWPLMRRRLTLSRAPRSCPGSGGSTTPLISLAGTGSLVVSRRSRWGLLGFVLFVGVLTERSRSVWSSVLAHGSWNGLVQSHFSSSGAVEDRVLTGSRYLLVSSAGWGGGHGDSRSRVRVVAFPYPNQGRSVPEGAHRLRVTGDVAVVPQHPKLKTPATAT